MCEGCPIESGMTTERSGMTTERSDIPDQVGDDDRNGNDDPSGMTSGSSLSFHLFVEVSDDVQDLGKEVGQGTFGRLETLCVGKSRELVQVVAQTRQIAEDGVMFMDEVLHDLGIDGCLPDIFGQCTESRRPRPVTDDVILQGAVSYGDGPDLLLHPARSRATAFVLSLHLSHLSIELLRSGCRKHILPFRLSAVGIIKSHIHIFTHSRINV